MKLRLVLANAQHIWNVPGRKSDRKAGRARIYVGQRAGSTSSAPDGGASVRSAPNMTSFSRTRD